MFFILLHVVLLASEMNRECCMQHFASDNALRLYEVYITYKLPGTTDMFYFISFTLCRQQVTLYCMFVAIMAFHARISDPRVGGTYLTLLNTVTNLGGNWCQTLALWLVDGLTWSSCVGASIPGLHCSGKIHAKVTN